MKISSAEEYGLRCLMILAANDDGEPLTIGDIADHEGLSLPHVGKVMGILKESGLVESVRGRSGGYVLKFPADELTLARVFRSLEGRLLERNFCNKSSRQSKKCVHMSDCSIESLWDALVMMMDQFLGQVTLADLGNNSIGDNLELALKYDRSESRSAR